MLGAQASDAYITTESHSGRKTKARKNSVVFCGVGGKSSASPTVWHQVRPSIGDVLPLRLHDTHPWTAICSLFSTLHSLVFYVYGVLKACDDGCVRWLHCLVREVFSLTSQSLSFLRRDIHGARRVRCICGFGSYDFQYAMNFGIRCRCVSFTRG